MSEPANIRDRIAIVAIGRNEGERLRLCLTSVQNLGCTGVYVDSGSTDGSQELAKNLGFEVVQLDVSIPFTAARARNAGFQRLLELRPDLQFVQFVDGDCELNPDWFSHALAALESDSTLAIVFGRRQERNPDVSIYNRICDLEWDVPPGQVTACGGDILARCHAIQLVAGYRESLIAGEEPEMCLRLRGKGYAIACLPHAMSIHDAAMTHFRQWWKRSLRAGHAYAEVAYLHRQLPEKFWQKECRSILLWGGILPTLALLLAYPTYGLSLALFFLYPLQIYRIRRYFKLRPSWQPFATLYATHCILAKFPQLQGFLRYHRHRLFSERSTLIEYK